MRHIYFRAVNGIMGKVGSASSPLVLSSLIETFCVSILLYAAEAFSWSKGMTESCENAYSQAYMKIFKTFDKHIVAQCQFYLGQLSAELKIVSRTVKFITSMRRSENLLCSFFSNRDSSLENLCNKYGIAENFINCEHVVRNNLADYFERLTFQ